jgi:hypothetical protein
MVFDRFGAIPVFATAAVGLMGLGLSFARALRQRQVEFSTTPHTYSRTRLGMTNGQSRK